MIFAKKPERVDLLVVGLGNPGSPYERTRHNVGYLVADVLVARHRLGKLKRAFHGRYVAGDVRGRAVGVLKPTTFMNVSGKSVAAALRALRLDVGQVLVVHDDIDLPEGRLRLRHDGGHGGHNGLRSLHELVGSEFDRLRVGVGRPPSTEPAVVGDYVLSPFDEPEEQVRELIEQAANAVERWVAEGLEAAMNAANAGEP